MNTFPASIIEKKKAVRDDIYSSQTAFVVFAWSICPPSRKSWKQPCRTGTVRILDGEVRDSMEAEMRAVIEGVCIAHHAEAEFPYVRCYPSVVIHACETEQSMEMARRDIALTIPKAWRSQVF